MYNERMGVLVLTQTAHYYEEIAERLSKENLMTIHTWNDRQLLGPLKGGKGEYGLIRIAIFDATEDREAGRELYTELRREMDFVDFPVLVLKNEKHKSLVWSESRDYRQDENLYLMEVDLTGGRKSPAFSQIQREVKKIMG